MVAKPLEAICTLIYQAHPTIYFRHSSVPKDRPPPPVTFIPASQTCGSKTNQSYVDKGTSTGAAAASHGSSVRDNPALEGPDQLAACNWLKWPFSVRRASHRHGRLSSSGHPRFHTPNPLPNATPYIVLGLISPRGANGSTEGNTGLRIDIRKPVMSFHSGACLRSLFLLV